MSTDTAQTFVGTTTFHVAGMTCDHCESAITGEIARIPGVESVRVQRTDGTVTVSASRPVERAAIAMAVDEAGYVLGR